MLIRRLSVIRLCVLGGVSLVLVSCSCLVPVSVAGSLPDGIRFELDETVRLAHASVKVYQNDSETITWEIQGKAKVGVIHYGVAPDKLTATVPPITLEAGKTYLFTLQTISTFLGPPCGGAVLFTIDTDGRPVGCRNLEACASLQIRG